MYLCIMTKICTKCKEEKDLELFPRSKRSKGGFDYYCKACHSKQVILSNQKDKDKYNRKRREQRASSEEYRKHLSEIKRKSYWGDRRGSLLLSAKGAIKRRGIECTLVKEDIIIPEVCPIFQVPFDRGRFSPSLDRIDNSKGYIKDNVWVISKIANRMKNDASLEEILTFCNNLPEFIKNKMI